MKQRTGKTMIRRVALLAVLLATAGLTAVVRSAPAHAAITLSNITSPSDGAHYIQTDANPSPHYAVTGTSNGTTGDSVDIRCYERPGIWDNVATGIPVDASGNFSTTSDFDSGYGTCVLHAVPSGYSATGDVAAYIGPEITVEADQALTIQSGPNAGKVYDYEVWYQSAQAFNNYESAFGYGFGGARLSYDHGMSSNFLWSTNAALSGNDATRSAVRVDGRDAYGPRSAGVVLPNSQGLPQVTHSATRDGVTGTTTIHETDPIVVCPKGTPFPPTPLACPKFSTAGVRLERTIVTDDGGLQVHVTDVWRSTDGKAHTISAHYDQWAEGYDYSSGVSTQVPVGVKMPWLSSTFKTFTGDAVYPGPASAPRTIFVRDKNTAPDGNTDFPRGAISFDIAPQKVEWKENSNLTLRDEGITIPAGGKRITREDFVIGTTQSVVAAKAAANEQRINPYRGDGLIKRSGATNYLGNNVYNTTGANQTTTAKRHRGSKAVFDIKVQNDGTAPDTFKLKGPGGGAAFGVRYYAGTTNITTAVENGTYKMGNLAPGASRTVRLVITVKSGATIGALRSWLVTATSTHDGTRKDAVKARVHVVSA
jgi:hypothetical protein